MLETLQKSLQEWKRSTNERQKLQHAFIFIAICTTVIAGLVSLVNDSLGDDILKLAGASAVIFISNAVVYSLLQSAVLTRIASTPKSKKSNS